MREVKLVLILLFVVPIGITVCSIFNSDANGLTVVEESDVSPKDIRLTALYNESIPISINGNEDFRDQAASNNWPGNGTIESPFEIVNLRISTVSLQVLIDIRNTDVRFALSNNLLEGGSDGIRRPRRRDLLFPGSLAQSSQ